MKPFAFDLNAAIPMGEVEALVAEMKRVITHVRFEAPPVDPWREPVHPRRVPLPGGTHATREERP